MSADYDCYKEYNALKLHFNDLKFDYFKYSKKSRTSEDSFNKRKDKVFFQKLAKHPDIHNFLVANFINDNKSWIRDLAYSKDAENTYKSWVKRQQSLSYIFTQELNQLDHSFNENFIVKSNQHPLLLKKYLAKEISIETLCLLLELTGAYKHWDDKLQYDLLWAEIKIKIKKYTQFIKVDRSKIKKIVLDYFSE